MGWNIIITRPAAEIRVLAALAEHHIEAYAPMETYMRSGGHRKIKTERPLIRGYVFAKLGERPHLVHDIDGAARLIMIAGRAAVLDSKFLGEIRDAEAAGVYDLTKSTDKALIIKPGVKVTITGGPFKGRAGVLGKLSAKRRVQVIISAMGPATISLQHLEAA